MPYRPHRLEPNYPGLEVLTSPSPAPPVVVQCWCGLVERMDRRTLDRFTRDIWKRFDHRDLEPAQVGDHSPAPSLTSWRSSYKIATKIFRARRCLRMARHHPRSRL